MPVAFWSATLIYIRPYDGWGAWAAAPLLLPALALSGLWAVAGTIAIGLDGWRTRRVEPAVVAATLVGGSVFFYYVVRYYVRPG